eukprot:1175421-Prorocentrum_minimum.AAC.1
MHLIGPPCAGGSAPGLPHPGEGGGPLGAASGVPPCGDALPSGQEPKRESSDSSAVRIYLRFLYLIGPP